MKVLIDGYWWIEGPQSNRMVLHEIVRQWVRDNPLDDLVLAVPAGLLQRVDPEVPAGVEVARTHLRMHPAVNFVQLPLIARTHGVDGILAFNFSANSSRGITFVHDMLFMSNPEWFTKIERVYFAAMPLLARRAACVVTTSNSERRRIERFNPAVRRVVDCGLAAPRSLTDAIPLDPGTGLSPGGFLLSVGRLNVRKNLERTLQACLRSGTLSAHRPLVIVGEPSGRVAEFNAEFADALSCGLVTVVENVDSHHLKWLYRNCALFLCMSLDEGFGLPPVEAALCGAPIVASDIPVFRENLGSYATLVDPTNVAATAAAVSEIIASDTRTPNAYVEPHSWHSVCEVIRGELQRLPATRRR